MANLTPDFLSIARATNQSHRALARRFAAEMGMSWRVTLRRIRILRAVEALATIAFSVGYISLSGFNAAFRDLMKMSPRNYRASFQT